MRDSNAKNVTVLDTTLRDGNNAVNFAFTANDVTEICSELEKTGISLIEVGHGFGLNAGVANHPAAESDEAYMRAARTAAKTAKVGIFCVPGLARLPDVEKAHECGMDFIRIGVNMGKSGVTASEKFITKARELGMFVFVNLLRSHLASPEEIAKEAVSAECSGANAVYIVDSAGSMFPETLAKYSDAVRASSKIPLGFHGHDNLGCAVANSLAAAGFGFEFIDCSLQGLGRGAGNAPTETVAAALQKQGYNTDVDMIKLMGAGERLVKHRIAEKGKSPIDIASGYSGFVSFFPDYILLIKRYAAKYNIHPARLIMEIAEIDRVNQLDAAELENLAKKIALAYEQQPLQ